MGSAKPEQTTLALWLIKFHSATPNTLAFAVIRRSRGGQRATGFALALCRSFFTHCGLLSISKTKPRSEFAVRST